MQDLRALARTTLARSLRGLPEQDRLALALPAVCGSALATHCRVAHLGEDGSLVIELDGPEWVEPLRGMRSMLLHDLERVAGVALSEVHFELANGRAGERR